jgi:hypothetical protein
MMRYEKHDDKLVYKGNERTIKTLGWWCTQRGEGILSGDALKGHEKAFLEFKAETTRAPSAAREAAGRALSLFVQMTHGPGSETSASRVE